MSQMYFHHDWETYSELNLRDTSASRYARHSSTVPLMLAYAFGDGPVMQWVPAEGEPIPKDVFDALHDSEIVKIAHNAVFEQSVWEHCFGWTTPYSSWKDTMVQAHCLAFPGSLDFAGSAIGIETQDKKMKSTGTRLINLFCFPKSLRKGEPPRRIMWHEKTEEWQTFKEYNRQDVVAERAIGELLDRHDIPNHEWDLWSLDRQINERGIPINRNAVENAIRIRDHFYIDRTDQLRRLTGLDNPASGVQFLPWIRRFGYPFDDLKRGHVERALKAARVFEDVATHEHQQYIRALELRLEVSRISSKKYDAFRSRTDDDGRLRQAVQFAAAGRTWRWGGRGVQVHNMPRPDPKLSKVTFDTSPGGLRVVTGGPMVDCVRDLETMAPEQVAAKYEKPFDLLATATRLVIQPSKGAVLVVFDLNAIENRVLGWVAREPKILRVFQEDRCPYMDFATDLYSMSYEAVEAEYKAGNKEKRTNAKPAVLGCGYLLGPGIEYEDPRTGAIEATGLLGYARNMFIDLSKEMSERSVAMWREAHPMVRKFWTDVETAAMNTVKTGNPRKVGYLWFFMEGSFLKMRLPSGRNLAYYQPEVQPMRKPWGDIRDTLTYMGKNIRNQWVRLTTHPGKITENAVQAIARDVLAAAMNDIERELMLPIVLHVHDEIVVEVPEVVMDHAWTGIRDCMIRPRAWAPGLILGAEGFATKWYLKD